MQSTGQTPFLISGNRLVDFGCQSPSRMPIFRARWSWLTFAHQSDLATSRKSNPHRQENKMHASAHRPTLFVSYASLAVLGLLAGACDPEPVIEDPYKATIDGEEEREARQVSDYIAWAEARRLKYETTGEIPTVPPELSDDPYDPNFVFIGYDELVVDPVRAAEVVEEGTAPPTQEEMDMADPDWTREDARRARREHVPLRLGEEVGYLRNPVGETWLAYATQEMVDEVQRVRAEGDQSYAPPGSDIMDEEEEFEHPGFRDIIYGDNRTYRSGYNGYDLQSYPYRTWGALAFDPQSPNVPYDGNNPTQGSGYRCSATKIGTHHLLTAAHCVYDNKQNRSLSFRWWPGMDGISWAMDGGDPSPNPIRQPFWVYTPPDYRNNDEDSLDISVIVLFDSQSVCSLGRLGIKEDWWLNQEKLWNWGWPGPLKKCDQSPFAGEWCNNSMWGMKDRIMRTNGKFSFYRHDDQEGQSGSPHYRISGSGSSKSRNVKNIVKGKWSFAENRGIPIRGKVFDRVVAIRGTFTSKYCDY